MIENIRHHGTRDVMGGMLGPHARKTSVLDGIEWPVLRVSCEYTHTGEGRGRRKRMLSFVERPYLEPLVILACVRLYVFGLWMQEKEAAG